jgi:hypothetical protein
MPLILPPTWLGVLRVSPIEQTLEQLIQSCEQQLQAYARTCERNTDSSSCVEIVQRAVASDDAALNSRLP